jgi:hypothetical protein
MSFKFLGVAPPKSVLLPWGELREKKYTCVKKEHRGFASEDAKAELICSCPREHFRGALKEAASALKGYNKGGLSEDWKPEKEWGEFYAFKKGTQGSDFCWFDFRKLEKMLRVSAGEKQ